MPHHCPHCGRRHTIDGGFYMRLLGIVIVVLAAFAFINRHELHRAICWR